MILPKKGEDNGQGNSTMNNLSAGLESKMQMNAKSEAGSGAKKQIGTKLELTNLDLSQKFQCTGSELYNTLTVPEVTLHSTYV